MLSILFSVIPFCVFLAVVLSLVGTVFYLIRKGKKTMRSLFGTDDLTALVRERELLEENTPKSVSGLTNLYTPMIQRDFPELNWMELRSTAENHLKDYLDKKNYTGIHIHQTEIRNYVKKSGTCTIIFQSAVEFYKAGKKTQSRYNIHMLYVQDSDLVERFTGVGLNCPNCGGALSSLGEKSCPYCGTKVIPINLNVWELDKIEEA